MIFSIQLIPFNPDGEKLVEEEGAVWGILDVIREVPVCGCSGTGPWLVIQSKRGCVKIVDTSAPDYLESVRVVDIVQ